MGKTIVVTLILCFTLMGCNLTSGSNSAGKIEFSLTRDEKTGDLGERTNVFKMTDNTFCYSTPLSGNTGKYEIIIEKDNTVFSDDKDNINVSPDWTGMTGSYITPYEAGKYTMKIFNIKEEKLVSAGDFEVVK